MTTPEPRSGDAIERSLGARVVARLVLPCALFILVGAIDRTNVSFAALQMNAELGISGTQYGFAAGVLFVGYVLAKYPSVLLYERLGLSRWLALITLLWGIGACGMAFVTREWHIYGLRLFIGLMEGGLSSGLMIYLSQWAPERWRASILALPIMAINVSQIIGGPLSGWLIDYDNPLGMAGWRFMFLAEGLPALALALFALLYFPDVPRQARFLGAAERDWIAANVRGAAKPSPSDDPRIRWEALRSPAGWTCAAIWYCILASNYGIMFWLPTIVKGMSGLSATQTGLVVALPNVAAAIGLLVNARHSDRTGERPLHIAVPALIGGSGLLAAYLLGPGIPGLLMLIVGAGCAGCTVAAFWAIPPQLLSPGGLAMGIVMINMLGSFAGATVPVAMGALREASGSFLPPTLLLFGIACLCAGLCLLVRRQMRALEAAR